MKFLTYYFVSQKEDTIRIVLPHLVTLALKMNYYSIINLKGDVTFRF
jgi:hypothetical protein